MAAQTVIHIKGGDGPNDLAVGIFGEIVPHRGQQGHECLDVTNVEVALGLVDQQIGTAGGDHIELLAAAGVGLRTAAHAHGDAVDLLVRATQHRARNAGNAGGDQILGQGAHLIGQFAPAPIHFSALLAHFFFECAHLIFE